MERYLFAKSPITADELTNICFLFKIDVEILLHISEEIYWGLFMYGFLKAPLDLTLLRCLFFDTSLDCFNCLTFVVFLRG